MYRIKSVGSWLAISISYLALMNFSSEVFAAITPLPPKLYFEIRGMANGDHVVCPLLGGFCSHNNCGVENYSGNAPGTLPTEACSGSLKLDRTSSSHSFSATYQGTLTNEGGFHGNLVRGLSESVDVYVIGNPGTAFKLEVDSSAVVTASKTEDVHCFPDCSVGSFTAKISAPNHRIRNSADDFCGC